jgi:hypothetical protein
MSTELQPRLIEPLVVPLPIGRRQRRPRVPLVQPVDRRRDVAPLPALRPALEVVVGRMHEHHIINGNSASEDTGRVAGRVLAYVLIPHVERADGRRQARQVDLGERVVPAQAVVRAGCHCRAVSSLQQEDVLLRLGQPFSRDDAGRTSSYYDVIIELLLMVRS